jgi:hypothetical protein
MQSGIKSEPDMLRLRQPSAKRHGGTLNRRMRRREGAKMNTKYDNALSQFPSRIIVVRCDTCGVDYDVRVVSNEVQHNGANHVIFFDCPKGHHCEARRLWESQEQEKSELAELFAEVRADLDRANDEFLALALSTVWTRASTASMKRTAKFYGSRKMSTQPIRSQSQNRDDQKRSWLSF